MRKRNFEVQFHQLHKRLTLDKPLNHKDQNTRYQNINIPLFVEPLAQRQENIISEVRSPLIRKFKSAIDSSLKNKRQSCETLPN